MREHLAGLEAAGLRTRKGFRSGWVATGEHAGVAYRVDCTFPRAQGPFTWKLSIPTDAPGDLRVAPEDAGSMMARALRMVSEFRCGDPAIDDTYYFAGTTDAYVKEVFGRGENLDLLRQFLAAGFRKFSKTPRRIAVTRITPQPPVVADLQRDVERLSGFRFPATAPGGVARRLLDLAILAAVCAGAFALFPLALKGIVSHPVVGGWFRFFIVTLPFQALLLLAVFFGARLVLRGRPMIAGTGIGVVVFVLAVLVCISFGLVAFVNERLDTGAAQVHEVEQVRRHKQRGRRGAESDEIVVKSWRGGYSETIVVQGGMQPTPDGTLWRVQVRPGFLGQPWVESIRPVKRQ